MEKPDNNENLQRTPEKKEGIFSNNTTENSSSGQDDTPSGIRGGGTDLNSFANDSGVEINSPGDVGAMAGVEEDRLSGESQKDFSYDTPMGINPNQNRDSLTNNELNKEDNLEYSETQSNQNEEKDPSTWPAGDVTLEDVENFNRKEDKSGLRGENTARGNDETIGNP
ncbi:MAG TPA: hypothetical protein VD908_16090 [Cytophagales bacterium]|nr:hypothetical protein [Cytophagales bacterium]